MEEAYTFEMSVTSIRPHGILTQKTVIFIHVAMKTWNLTKTEFAKLVLARNFAN